MSAARVVLRVLSVCGLAWAAWALGYALLGDMSGGMRAFLLVVNTYTAAMGIWLVRQTSRERWES